MLTNSWLLAETKDFSGAKIILGVMRRSKKVEDVQEVSVGKWRATVRIYLRTVYYAILIVISIRSGMETMT